MLADLLKLLNKHYGIGKATVTPIQSGAMNHNFIVETTEETYVLKAYATRLYKPEWIRQTCEVQNRVQAGGVPVSRLIHTLDGQILCQTDAGFYLLSRFVEGRHHARKQIPAKAAFEMGRTLGQLLEALRQVEDVTPFALPDPGERAAHLRKLAGAAELLRAESVVDETAYQVLCAKLEALERLCELPVRLGDVPTQWVHGDYHDLNVIFDEEDYVVAVIDFDNLRCRPRGYEVMRAMSICFFDGKQLLPAAYDFFAGYVEALAVSAAEITTYAPLWTYLNLVGVWPLQTRYENREAYDPRWDLYIDPPNNWWERHMDEVTERLLAVLAAKAAKFVRQ
jgi:Ser/Thr protein kinase RdoA (MazF antagonist)